MYLKKWWLMHPKQDAPFSQTLPVVRQSPAYRRPFVCQKVTLSCPSPTGDVPIVAIIRFRWEMGLLTDHIVSMFCLPMPNSQTLLFLGSIWLDELNQSHHPRLLRVSTIILFYALARRVPIFTGATPGLSI